MRSNGTANPSKRNEFRETVLDTGVRVAYDIYQIYALSGPVLGENERLPRSSRILEPHNFTITFIHDT